MNRYRNTLSSNLSRLCLIGAAALSFGLGNHAHAASPAKCDLRIATGEAGKGYSKMYSDIVSMCGERTGMALCEVHTAGGLENLTKLSANGADLAPAQVDTAAFMKDSDSNIAALQAVMALHANLLHPIVLVNGYIQNVTVAKAKTLGMFGSDSEVRSQAVVLSKFSQLKGQPVAVTGSAQHMVRVINMQLGLGMQLVDFPDDASALAALRSNQVHAVLTLSGWPLPLLQNQDAKPVAKDLALLNFDMQPTPPLGMTKRNYPDIRAYNIPMLAAPNVLFTRPFRPDGEKGRAVAKLQSCLFSHLPDLKEGDFRPGWKEIADPATSYNWPLFPGTRSTSAQLQQDVLAPAKQRAVIHQRKN
jgi:TRAP-type uncharacterized transport system substrate-binding protein